MNRRELIAWLGSAAISQPLPPAHAQPALPVIGVLGITSFAQEPASWAAFLSGLRETGYVEGENVLFEYRSAEGRNDRLPVLAGELVARKVKLIVTGGLPGVRAAKSATATIPILVGVGVDPVAFGVVSNLA